jgi:hypothetical protein
LPFPQVGFDVRALRIPPSPSATSPFREYPAQDIVGGRTR